MPYKRPQAIIAILLLALSLLVLARGQNCKRLAPAGPGQDDAARINQCLTTKGRAKLTAGTFLLYDTIVFPGGKTTDVSGVTLIGKGMDATRLVPQQADCQNHWPFVEQQPGQYKGVIQILRSPAAVVHGLEIDLVNLRRDCGYGIENAITVNRSPGSEVSQVRVKGSRYGDADYTSGGANWGGVFIVNSENSMVTDNEITDVAFTVEVGGLSAGHEGIFIQNSANAIVQNNRITRVAFGIEVVNGSPSLNYTGNSSGTVVVGNTIIGAANINCPDCAQGRGIKLQACGAGDELPLENLTVGDNDASQFG